MQANRQAGEGPGGESLLDGRDGKKKSKHASYAITHMLQCIRIMRKDERQERKQSTEGRKDAGIKGSVAQRHQHVAAT